MKKLLHDQKGYGSIFILSIILIILAILYFLYPDIAPRKEDADALSCYIEPSESTLRVTGDDGQNYVLLKPAALTIRQQVGYHFTSAGETVYPDGNAFPTMKVILDDSATMNDPPLPTGFVIYTQPGRPEGGTYRPTGGAEDLRFVDVSANYGLVDRAYAVLDIFLLEGQPVPPFILEYCSNELPTKSVILFQDTQNKAIPNVTINSGEPSDWENVNAGPEYAIYPRPNLEYKMFAYDKRGSNSFALSTGQTGPAVSKNTYTFISEGRMVTYDGYFLINSSTEQITLVNTNPDAPDADIGYKYTPAEFAPSLDTPPNLNKNVNNWDERTIQWKAFVPFLVPTWGWWTPECKPAIYLYPEQNTLVNVKVFPEGFLTYTDPVYNAQTGWTVFANSSGKLTTTDNKQFDYLYYESKINDAAIEEPETGYIVTFNDLPNFYKQLLPKLGLNEKETSDYISYWTTYLPKQDYYFIGVMSEQAIEKIEPLRILPQPQTTIRVRLYYQGLTEKQAVEKQKTIQPPASIDIPKRQGFTMVEWGGMVKRDKNHPFTCSE